MYSRERHRKGQKKGKVWLEEKPATIENKHKTWTRT